ncbi:AAA family ATPase [Methanococcoides alaskense]|uniref:MoxR-like ATPase n=1 Tax=Methanococcoides alaskense TaxID=325778 RepID=A0AA90ZCR4_9EURY|nr:MoxR family ATPase [Methanococcoides alaskense]MDA0525741.1 MoxR family ATPase [Methanococcoides alaskense]MDR6222967.1 MoxR-like ATPase [Methanococcoides alaskense]
MNSNDAGSGDLEQTYRGAGDAFSALFNEISKVIVGQKDTVEQIIIAILSNGHALMESNPGLGKTLTVSTISKTMDLGFSRIQCTPDLMPADITGTHFIEETGGKKEFKFEPGPVFANIVLADEINRASPKTQSALLEAMQEKQVTVGNDTFILDKPFFLLATQNPIEMEGTFPLPEAQLDRFLLKIVLDYPSFEEEKEIVRRYTKSDEPHVEKVLNKNMVLQLQRLTRDMPIADDIKERAIKIIMATRTWKEFIEFGASPRASIGLILAAKARALVRGRNFVSVEDVDAMAYPVLRHRIILTFESERRGISQDHVIKEILAKIK